MKDLIRPLLVVTLLVLPAVPFPLAAQSNDGGQIYSFDGNREAAVAESLKRLVEIMNQNGGDSQRAMRTFVQSPEGEKIIWVHGAFPEINGTVRRPDVVTAQGEVAER
jgi:hypothetical protein